MAAPPPPMGLPAGPGRAAGGWKVAPPRPISRAPAGAWPCSPPSIAVWCLALKAWAIHPRRTSRQPLFNQASSEDDRQRWLNALGEAVRRSWPELRNPEGEAPSRPIPHSARESLPIGQRKCFLLAPTIQAPVHWPWTRTLATDPTRSFDLLVIGRRAPPGANHRLRPCAAASRWVPGDGQVTSPASGTSKPAAPSCCTWRRALFGAAVKPLICASCSWCASCWAERGHWLQAVPFLAQTPWKGCCAPPQPAGHPPNYGAAWAVYDLSGRPAAHQRQPLPLAAKEVTARMPELAPGHGGVA